MKHCRGLFWFFTNYEKKNHCNHMLRVFDLCKYNGLHKKNDSSCHTATTRHGCGTR